MRSLAIATLAASLAALTACSSDYEKGNVADTGAQLGDTGVQPEDSPPDEQDGALPAWFTPDGLLEVLDGALVSAVLDLRVHDADASPEPLCVARRQASGIETAVVTPDPSVFHWWVLTLDPAVDGCGDSVVLPDRLALGLGRMHPELEPAVEWADVAADPEGLYGAYASFGELDIEAAAESTAYAFGFAGTDRDRSGDTLVVDAAPVPDGQYFLTGFYLFPLPSE